jgi:hypothetical protein
VLKASRNLSWQHLRDLTGLEIRIIHAKRQKLWSALKHLRAALRSPGAGVSAF